MTGNRYGAIRVGARTLPAHRVIYEEAHGPTDAPAIDHLCRVPACVRVDHLEPVPVAVNTRRGRTAILTKAQALAIRERRTNGERGVDLAAEYGVSQQTVCCIFKGRHWVADLHLD